jgi:[acyl-carrier-protein] S-malonyltransferase
MARGRGARKATLLAVSAPFHSPLMRPAREAMAELLARADFRDPQVPVVTNVDARPATTAAAARDALVRQIDSPVRWVESVAWMAAEAGVATFLEVGPGNVLAGLVRRIATGSTAAGVADPEQLRKLTAPPAEPEPAAAGVGGGGAGGAPGARGAQEA